ncbi:MAG: TonB-dependent siderophore receptor [Advenella sp.]|uniref:TonB-dependent siderophore receptor n=1 Tax=Advenella sp. TaxID=1872388 RepID=UPI003F9C1A16
MGMTVLIILIAVAMGIASGPAIAQDRSVQFRIPPLPLSKALLQFGEQASLQVFFSQEIVKGHTASALTGNILPEDGLRRLLAGTEIEFRRTGKNVSLSRPSSPSNITQLETITVQRENAWGPVEDYVAQQSASGSKTDAAIIETPQTINVIGRSEMEARNVHTTADALAYTPGVSAAWAGYDVRFDVIKLRGFNANYATYQNGLRSISGEYVIPRLNPYGAERIEVLKGPASVLYGQNTPGGLINYVGKQPSEETLREIVLEAGSHRHAQAGFDFSGPVDEEGKLLYRLTGEYRNAKSHIEHVKEGGRFIAPSLTWKPSTYTTFTLSAQYQRDIVNGWTGYFWPIQGTLHENPNGKLDSSLFPGEPGVDRWDVERRSIGYRLDQRFNETWSFSQNVRYDDINFSAGNSFLDGFAPDMRHLNRSYVGWKEDVSAIMADNQLKAEFTTGEIKHTLLAGLDVRRMDNDYRFFMGELGPIDAYDPVYGQRPKNVGEYTNTRTRTSQVGYYLQDQLRYGRWVLTLGGRYDRAWSNKTGVNFGSDAAQHTDDSAWTGRAGLVYLFDNGFAPYISYSTSFEPASGVAKDGSLFRPTRGKQYEAGLRYQPKESSSFITLSVFQLTQENVVATDPADPNFSAQTGQVRTRGLEIEGKAKLRDGWNLIASYALMNSKVTRNTPDFTGVNTQGNLVDNVPRHQAALWISHTSSAGALQGLTAGAGVRYRSATYGDQYNDIRMTPVTLVDVKLSYDLGAINPSLHGLKGTVSVNNLFDKRYTASCDSETSCYRGEERKIYGALTYRW